MSTPVNPDHYKKGGLEVIDILAAKLTAEEFKGFCKGNIIKYVTRANYKNGVEDIKKARTYCDFLIEFMGGNDADEETDKVQKFFDMLLGGDKE